MKNIPALDILRVQLSRYVKDCAVSRHLWVRGGEARQNKAETADDERVPQQMGLVQCLGWGQSFSILFVQA